MLGSLDLKRFDKEFATVFAGAAILLLVKLFVIYIGSIWLLLLANFELFDPNVAPIEFRFELKLREWPRSDELDEYVDELVTELSMGEARFSPFNSWLCCEAYLFS